MTCCAGHCAAAGFFDSRIANRDLRRYQRRGPDTSTRMLLAELRRWQLQDLELLDVGSGIGVIAAELAAAGLASATLADASPAYLEFARRIVGSSYGSRPTQFILGNFTATAASLPEADASAVDARARRLLAFTHPPGRWYLRAGFSVVNFFLWIGGSPFRIFVHPPEQMAAVLEAAGLVRAAHRESFLWSFSLYRRPLESAT